MDRIDGMKAFVAVVETGSFSAAARRLGISNKLVSKYIANLETQVGATLLFRTTRSMSISPEGKTYLEGCRRVLLELDALEASLAPSDALHGTLRIAAPVTFGEVLVTDAVVDFMADHPAIEVELVLSDTHEDLAERGFDLAIRIGQLADSNLRVRKLGETRLSVVASPAYLREYGTPSHPDALENHICIRDSNSMHPGRWSFEVDAKPVSVPVQGPLMCNSASACLNAARKGVGLTMLPDLFAQNDLASGDVVQVLQSYTVRTVPVQAVYLASAYERPKVTAFVEHMKAEILRSKARCDAART